MTSDVTQTDTTAKGADGPALLKIDETDANQKDATASPILIINGLEFSGSCTPEAYKTAICYSPV